MPVFDYKCPYCGEKVFDEWVKKHDEPRACPRCDTPMEKLPPNSNWKFSHKERRWDA